MIALCADGSIIAAKIPILLTPGGRRAAGARDGVHRAQLMVRILVNPKSEISDLRHVVKRVGIEIRSAIPNAEVKANLHVVVNRWSERNALSKKSAGWIASSLELH